MSKAMKAELNGNKLTLTLSGEEIRRMDGMEEAIYVTPGEESRPYMSDKSRWQYDYFVAAQNGFLKDLGYTDAEDILDEDVASVTVTLPIEMELEQNGVLLKYTIARYFPEILSMQGFDLALQLGREASKLGRHHEVVLLSETVGGDVEAEGVAIFVARVKRMGFAWDYESQTHWFDAENAEDGIRQWLDYSVSRDAE
jgi:hypothetical protein